MSYFYYSGFLSVANRSYFSRRFEPCTVAGLELLDTVIDCRGVYRLDHIRPGDDSQFYRAYFHRHPTAFTSAVSTESGGLEIRVNAGERRVTLVVERPRAHNQFCPAIKVESVLIPAPVELNDVNQSIFEDEET